MNQHHVALILSGNRVVAVTPDDNMVELQACYERIDELETTLNEARLQIEYLHDKFQPTGTSESVLGRIYAVLS